MKPDEKHFNSYLTIKIVYFLNSLEHCESSIKVFLYNLRNNAQNKSNITQCQIIKVLN